MFTETISYGGRVVGFSLAAAGDPSIWEQLSTVQQSWVMNTLNILNSKIEKTTGTKCPTYGPSITAAGGCFQAWWNASGISPQKIRTDGVFDEETLCALITVAGIYTQDFPSLFPDPEGKYCRLPGGGAPAPAPQTVTTTKPKLSKGAMIGIGAGAIVVIGGVAYALSSSRRSKKKKDR